MSDSLLIGVSSLAVAGGITAYGTSLLVNTLADTDKFFTKVPEGTAKAIMRSNRFHRFVMSLHGRHLNDPTDRDTFDPQQPDWEVLDDELDSSAYDKRDPISQWVGVFPFDRSLARNFLTPYFNVKTYMFEWNEERFKPGENEGRTELWSRKESTNFIYVSDFPYLAVLDAAETDEGLPVDIRYQIMVRITNPFKALFETENWLKVVIAAANRCARSYVGSRTYKQLQSETNPKETEKKPGVNPCEFSYPIVHLTEKLPDDPDKPEGDPEALAHWESLEKGLAGRYGVTIVSANPQTVDLSGPNAAKYQDATVQEFVADKEASTIRKKGDADAAAKLAIGTADAQVIKATGDATAESLKSRLSVLSEYGELGKLLAQTDAMKADSPGKTIIWANAPFISENPGLGQVLNKLGVSPDQFKNIVQNNQHSEEIPHGSQDVGSAVGDETSAADVPVESERETQE